MALTHFRQKVHLRQFCTEVAVWCDMPKKFIGENSKAAEARARKEAQRQEELSKKQHAAEDEFWKDDDKHVVKKQQRKDEREKKRVEQAEKKLELKKLHDEEMDAIKAKTASQPQTKLTRAQIEISRQKEETAARASGTERQDSVEETPIIENLNRSTVDAEEARTVDDAITVLGGTTEKIDMHPEKRMKAAYTKFEEENLPILKKENPNMRLSQLKQMLKKQWMKSPENPLNQRMASLNATK